MALPAMVVLLASRAILGPNVWVLLIVLGVLVAHSFFRLVRGELYVEPEGADQPAGREDAARQLLAPEVAGPGRVPSRTGVQQFPFIARTSSGSPARVAAPVRP